MIRQCPWDTKRDIESVAARRIDAGACCAVLGRQKVKGEARSDHTGSDQRVGPDV